MCCSCFSATVKTHGAMEISFLWCLSSIVNNSPHIQYLILFLSEASFWCNIPPETGHSLLHPQPIRFLPPSEAAGVSDECLLFTFSLLSASLHRGRVSVPLLLVFLSGSSYLTSSTAGLLHAGDMELVNGRSHAQERVRVRDLRVMIRNMSWPSTGDTKLKLISHNIKH